MSTVYVLDTNIVSAVIRATSPARENFFEAIRSDASFLLCPIVYFEMHRGLVKKNATSQLRAFNRLISIWQ